MSTFLLRRVLVCPMLLFMALPLAYAQWTEEWSSASTDINSVSGWLDFQQSGDQWLSRYYTLDSVSFRLMSSAYSQTPAYTYTFNNAERLADLSIYSVGADLTGDGMVEFYVLADYGADFPYRQAFKIFNIVTGATVFQRDDAGYSYGYPTIWDADDDGIYECTFVRYDYASGADYINQVFQTGAPASARNGAPIPRQVDLRQNYPNPFNPSTRIDYALSTPADVRLDISNVLGQRVQSVGAGSQTAGMHSMLWNGRDERGDSVPSGTYFYRLITDGQPQASRKMVLVR